MDIFLKPVSDLTINWMETLMNDWVLYLSIGLLTVELIRYFLIKRKGDLAKPFLRRDAREARWGHAHHSRARFRVELERLIMLTVESIPCSVRDA